MIRNIKERRFLKITTVVDDVWMCIKTFAYVIILSPVILSCSFDEPWDDLSTTSLDDNNDDETYIAIELTDGSSPLLAKATPTEENAVNDVHFYFYDGDGNYVSQGEIDPDGTEESWSTSSDSNVEIQSSNGLVILKGLTGTDFLKYVVAVVNQPTDFSAPYKLKDIPTSYKTVKTSSTGVIGSTSNGLVMTSSTYYDDNPTYPYPDGVSYTYFTELKSTDFQPAPVPETVTATVSIPIERLAAKVTVKVESGLENEHPITDGHTLYEITDGEETKYVELLGWKINAVARESYLFKNIEWPWNSLSSSWDWNAPGKYRCYWAKSFNYGLTDSPYPESNIKGTNTDPNTPEKEADEETWLNDYVEYVSLETVNNFYESEDKDNSDYCPENTNTVALPDGVLKSSKSSAITSVLVKAMLCDDEGNMITNDTDYPTGYMYYTIPIKHSYNDNNDLTLSEGEYGVVRNHHYTITITSVNNLGKEIENLEAVIVPNADDNLGFTTTSLPWGLQEEKVNHADGYNGSN